MENPITPEEALKVQNRKIPDIVIKFFNDAIRENLSRGQATVDCEDIVIPIAKALDLTIDQVIEKRLWDVEELYRSAGWEVDIYDSNPPTYYFKVPKRN